MLGEKYTLDIRPTFINHEMEVRWFRYSRSIRGLSANPVYDTSDPYEE